MEIKGVEWTIYTLIILLGVIIILFAVLFTIKCLRTSIHSRHLCCIKPRRRRMTSTRQAATSNNNEMTQRSSDTDSSASSSDSDSEDIEIQRTNMRQSDHVHENHGFVSDFDNSIRIANPSSIVNRKYDDTTRRFFNCKNQKIINNNNNNINTISSSIDYTLNLDDHYLTEFENQQQQPQIESTQQIQDDQSVQIDLENTFQMRTQIEEISTLSNCSILSDLDDQTNEEILASRFDTTSTDEIPPNYEQIVTGENSNICS